MSFPTMPHHPHQWLFDEVYDTEYGTTRLAEHDGIYCKIPHYHPVVQKHLIILDFQFPDIPF